MALAHNDTVAAIVAYRKATRLRPGTPQLYANLGTLEQENGDYADAEKDLRKAVNLSPALFSAQLFLGLSELHLSKPREAVPALLVAVHLNPDDIHARLALGRAYVALEDWPKAIAVYRRVVAATPRESSAWFALGISYLQQVEDDSEVLSGTQPSAAYTKALFADALAEQHRYVEAAALYRETEQEISAPPCVGAARGLVLLRQDHKSEGRGELEHARTKEPSCNLALIGLAAIDIQELGVNDGIANLKESWARDEGFTRSSLRQLISMLSSEQIQTIRSALARDSTRGATAFNGHDLASVFENADRDEASLSIEDAVGNEFQRQSGVEATDMRRAQREYADGHYATCLSQFETRPVHAAPASLRLKTTCAFLTGNYAAASESASLLLGMLPHDAEGLYWSIKSDEQLAIFALNRFAMLAPDSVKTHLLLGDINRQRRRYGEAVEEYMRCLQMDPANYAALQGLASAYLLDGKFKDSSTAAEKALMQRPDDPEANILMAESLLEDASVGTSKFEAAEPYLKKALTGKPQFVIQAHALLGRIYMETGHEQEAFTELKLGLSGDEDGSLHYLLGRLYTRRGDKVSAGHEFQQAKEFSIDRARRAKIASQEVVRIEDSLP